MALTNTDGLVIDERDNVATLIHDVQAGDSVKVCSKAVSIELKSETDVPFGHKIAIMDIEAGSQVFKYGEPIGIAKIDIRKGEHVHVHNVEGIRGRGDLAQEERS